MLWQIFQCGYDHSLNKSCLARDQISKYCNNQIFETENIRDLTIFGFNTIFIVIGWIIIRMAGGIWLILRRKNNRSISVSVDMGNNGGEGIN